MSLRVTDPPVSNQLSINQFFVCITGVCGLEAIIYFQGGIQRNIKMIRLLGGRKRILAAEVNEAYEIHEDDTDVVKDRAKTSITG